MAGQRRPRGRLHSGVNVMCLISGFVPREIISALVNPSKSPSQAELWLQALSAPAGRGRSQAEPPSELMKVDSSLGEGRGGWGNVSWSQEGEERTGSVLAGLLSLEPESGRFHQWSRTLKYRKSWCRRCT